MHVKWVFWAIHYFNNNDAIFNGRNTFLRRNSCGLDMERRNDDVKVIAGKQWSQIVKDQYAQKNVEEVYT